MHLGTRLSKERLKFCAGREPGRDDGMAYYKVLKREVRKETHWYASQLSYIGGLQSAKRDVGEKRQEALMWPVAPF